MTDDPVFNAYITEMRCCAEEIARLDERIAEMREDIEASMDDGFLRWMINRW